MRTPRIPPKGLQERLTVALTDGETTTTVSLSQVGEDGDWYGQSSTPAATSSS